MRPGTRRAVAAVAALAAVTVAAVGVTAQQKSGGGQPANKQPATGPDALKQSPPTAGGQALPDGAEVLKKAKAYLEARYDLSGKADPQAKMSGGRKGVPI